MNPTQRYPEIDRLSRFIAAHGHGEVTFGDLTETDLIEGDAKIAVTAHCDSCGATHRDHADLEWILDFNFADFFELVDAIGISREEFIKAMDDETATEEIRSRLYRSPAFFAQALKAIRKSPEGAAQ